MNIMLNNNPAIRYLCFFCLLLHLNYEAFPQKRIFRYVVPDGLPQTLGLTDATLLTAAPGSLMFVQDSDIMKKNSVRTLFFDGQGRFFLNYASTKFLFVELKDSVMVCSRNGDFMVNTTDGNFIYIDNLRDTSHLLTVHDTMDIYPYTHWIIEKGRIVHSEMINDFLDVGGWLFGRYTFKDAPLITVITKICRLKKLHLNISLLPAPYQPVSLSFNIYETAEQILKDLASRNNLGYDIISRYE